MKTVRVVLSPDCEVVYDQLETRAAKSKNERTLFNGIKKKIDLMRNNIHYGNPMAKDLIPYDYKVKYEAKNLFRAELPGFWRMLYTLKSGLSDDEIVVLVLDIIDHDDYNKKFGYKSH